MKYLIAVVMSKLWKVFVFGACLAYLAYYIHHPIPANIPDTYYFQVIVDHLSAAEFIAYLTEWLGFSNRWWFYPGNIDFPLPFPKPEHIEFEYAKFANVESIIVVPKEFKSRSTPGPALVFYHGGGWVFGSLNTYKMVLQQAAEETGFMLIALEYRKAPQYSFPIPFEDCLYATIDFMMKAKDYNFDPSKVAIIGDSAGGNLAMAVTLELLKLKKTNLKIGIPAMTTLIYPVLQMANFRLPSYQQNEKFFFYRSLIPKLWLSYIGLNDRMNLAEILAVNGHIQSTMEEKVKVVSSIAVPAKYKSRGYNATKITLTSQQKRLLDKEVLLHIERSYMDIRIAPMMASDDELKAMPPTYILVCEYDPLRDDGILLYDRMKRLGKTVSLQYIPDSLHASLNVGSLFPNTYYGEQNRILFKAISDFLEPSN